MTHLLRIRICDICALAMNIPSLVNIYWYSRLSLSRNPKDCLKHFEISVLRHIRFAELRKIINPTTTFNRMNLKFDSQVRDLLKILRERGEIAPKEQFLLFSTIFCCLLVDLCVKIGTRFLPRDKRLFEICELEIPRVDCIYSLLSGHENTDGRAAGRQTDVQLETIISRHCLVKGV